MRWNLEGLRSHIDLLVNIHTGDDKEDPGTPGSSCEQPTQSEDDGPLVLLDHLDDEEEREGHGGDDDQHRHHCQELSKQAGTLLANCKQNNAIMTR